MTPQPRADRSGMHPCCRPDVFCYRTCMNPARPSWVEDDGSYHESNAKREPIQARPVLDQCGRRHGLHQGRQPLARRLERDRASRAESGCGGARIHPADCALEGLWRRDQRTCRLVRDAHARRRAFGRHPQHRDLRDRARAAGAPGVCRQGADDRRSRQSRPRRPQYRLRLESGRVRHVRPSPVGAR